MRSLSSRQAVRGLAALVVAGSCAGFLAVSPSRPAPQASGNALPVAEAAIPSPSATPLTPAETAALARRAAELADAASRSERRAFTQDRAAQLVTVRVDGHLTKAWTRTATVAEVLAELKVRVRPADVVTPALTAKVQHGQAIAVARVVGKRVTATVRLEFGRTSVADPRLARGKERLVRTGSPGAATQVWALTYRDGKLYRRALVSSTVTTAPRDTVVAYGTLVPKPVVSVSSNGYPTFGGLNWRALASCESGNNAHSRDGPYHGLYQFLLGTWQSVGGSGDPADASIYEQTHRAWLLYQREGRHPWPVCGKYL